MNYPITEYDAERFSSDSYFNVSDQLREAFRHAVSYNGQPWHIDFMIEEIKSIVVKDWDEALEQELDNFEATVNSFIEWGF